MRKSELPRVFVSGTSYTVRESAGLLKADMNGFYGWTSVWADESEELKRRIRKVRSGGQ